MLDRVLVFMLAGQRFALPDSVVHECLPLPRLQRRPGQPPAVAGFFRFGALTLPVLDLGRLLDLHQDAFLPEAGGLYRHLLRLDGVALLVDRALGFALSTEAPADAAPDRWQHGCVDRRVMVDGEPAMLLDPLRILRQDERERLDALHEAACRRAEAWNEEPVRDAAG